MRIWVSALVFALAALSSVQAQTAASSAVKIVHVWARATPPAATTGVIYLTLLNSGTSDDQLLGGSSPVAEKVQFHSSMEDNGVMKMRELESIDIAPGATAALKPSSTHLMLLRLKHQLVAGQTFPLTLTFEKAGPIEVEVLVGTVGAMDDPAGAPK